MHASYNTIFVLIKDIGWHPQQYKFSHFYPFLIGSSLSKRVQNRWWCNRSDFHLINRFWVEKWNGNVSPFSRWVFSPSLDHWFLLIKKIPKLQKVRFIWFLPYKPILGQKSIRNVFKCSKFVFTFSFDHGFLLIKKSSKQKMMR